MADAPGTLLAIGNFDGVHRGHQAVLAESARDARAQGLAAAILTFSPHPAVALGRRAPPLLTTLPRKLELFRRAAPSMEPRVERFDEAFAAQSPEAFARDMLVGRFGARLVVVGQNFRFGKDRAGDFDTLTRLGEALGFATRSHALLGDEHGTWSSTRVREALRRGDLDEATAILGRPHSLTGTVARGDQRGRTLGFPTANVHGIEEARPAFGVYAVLVDRTIDGHARALAGGVANIGVRPTVKEGAPSPSVEVHLFDFEGDLYDAHLRVHLVGRLRAEQRFTGLDALKAQIALDAASARAIVATLSPDPVAHGAYR